MKTITKQKHILLICLLLLNILLSTLVIVYDKYWYIFIVILAAGSLTNSINTILLIYIKLSKWVQVHLINKLKNREQYILNDNQITNDKFIYILPCYNETEGELNNTIYSILGQSKVEAHSKLLVIICDGKINSESGKGLRTDKILTNIIFKDYIKESVDYANAYRTWNYDENKINKWNNLEFYSGEIKGLKFLIIVKSINLGKRDSLTLIRRLCNYYNNSISTSTSNITSTDISTTTPDNKDNLNTYSQYFAQDLLIYIQNIFNDVSIHSKIVLPISYIIGTDADTILDTNCSSELISSIRDSTNADSNTESKVVGVVGFVDIVKNWNPLVIYQYCEYLYAQCLRRQIQSIVTKKVNCLSGCVQLIKVCDETCGNKILDAFNRLPEENEHIFNHIRSYASEDRNHICLMFSMFPYVETLQNIKAISYTNVPNTLIKFIRQRKRWCAGASCNDILLIFNKKHNKWERIQSLINVIIFSLTIFIFISTIIFIISIVKYPTILMLQLSTIMILPALYSLMIPFAIYNEGTTMSKKLYNIIYYYSGFILYNSIGSLLNIIVYLYTLYYLDDLNWNSKKINSLDTKLSLDTKTILDTKINTTIKKNSLSTRRNTTIKKNTINDLINFISIDNDPEYIENISSNINVYSNNSYSNSNSNSNTDTDNNNIIKNKSSFSSSSYV